jgi:hypothetical protein
MNTNYVYWMSNEIVMQEVLGRTNKAFFSIAQMSSPTDRLLLLFFCSIFMKNLSLEYIF